MKRILFSLFLINSFFFYGQEHNHPHDLKYVNPRYSPNGEYILASAEGYTGLYVLDAQTMEQKKVFKKEMAIGYGATWSNDSKSIYYRYKVGFEFKTKQIDIHTGQEKASEVNPLIFTCKGYIGNSFPYLTNSNQIQYGDKVMGELGDNYYHLVANQTNTAFVAHLGSKIVLVDIKNNQITELTWGLANAISADGRYIYFHRDYSSDGHHITGGELFVYDVVEKKETQLTSTSEAIELWPDISPDGTKLVYSDDKTGKIEVLNINTNK